jgi:hypothetical protein
MGDRLGEPRRDEEERARRVRQAAEDPDGVTAPPTDPVREAKERDVEDPADVPVSAEEWRQGGPTRSPGAMTTTGGTAGPAMRRTTRRRPAGKVAPTTPGDATSGGMDQPAGGTTSDASGPPVAPLHDTGRPDHDADRDRPDDPDDDAGQVDRR